jgi:hypothetical protein
MSNEPSSFIKSFQQIAGLPVKIKSLIGRTLGKEGCTDVVTVLLNRAAKVNIRDDQKRTPLLRAEQWHQDNIVQLLKLHGGTE